MRRSATDRSSTPRISLCQFEFEFKPETGLFLDGTPEVPRAGSTIVIPADSCKRRHSLKTHPRSNIQYCKSWSAGPDSSATAWCSEGTDRFSKPVRRRERRDVLPSIYSYHVPCNDTRVSLERCSHGLAIIPPQVDTQAATDARAFDRS